MADNSAPPVFPGGVAGGAAAGSPPTDYVSPDPIDFDPRIQLGRTGLKQYGGFLFEDFLHILRGKEGSKAYREVIDNSPLVGGIMRLLKLTMRQVNKFVEPFSDDAEDIDRAERVEKALDDMSVSWPDLMAEVATMLGYGYAPMEIVWKKCSGWTDEGETRSRFDDGLIMPRKIYLMAQDTLFRWNFDTDGGVRAFVQLAPPDYVMRVIPIEKMLLFRPELEKGNPEGNSLIRSGYFSWVTIKRLTEFEAIQAERDSVGVPIARIPANTMLANSTPAQKAVFTQFKKLVQNLRIDDQAGAVIPSDVWPDRTTPMFDVKLMGLDGRAQRFDFGATITRHEVRLAMSMLADIMLLGHDKVGSFALSRDKRSMLADALGAWLDAVTAVFSRHLFARIFSYNGWPMDRVCKMGHGGVEDEDLDQLANAALKLSQAGMPLFPDQNLENHIREEAGWPQIQRDDEMSEEGPPIDAQLAEARGIPAGQPEEPDLPTAATPTPLKQPIKRLSKYRHQPRNRQWRYSPRGGDITSALQLLRDRARMGQADDVHHGFHVAEPPPYDPRSVTQKDIDTAPVERVKLKDLTATQRTVRREHVRRFLENPALVVPGQRALGGELEDRAVVVRTGGKSYIHDGHKRLAARVLLGYEDAVVRVIDYDDQEPHVARPSPPLAGADAREAGLPANQGTPRRVGGPSEQGAMPAYDPNTRLDKMEAKLDHLASVLTAIAIVTKAPTPAAAGPTIVVNPPAPGPPAAVQVDVAGPVIHVDVPAQPAPKVEVNVPAQPAPIVNVAAAPVEKADAPTVIVNVPEQKPPTVNVIAKPGDTIVNVAAPNVTVEAPEPQPPMVKEINRDEWGRIKNVTSRPPREDD